MAPPVSLSWDFMKMTVEELETVDIPLEFTCERWGSG